MVHVWHFLLAILCLLKHGRGDFIFSTTPLHIAIGITENVTFYCGFRGSVSYTDFQSISRLRIMKKASVYDDYKIVAEAKEHENDVDTEGLSPSVIATGRASDVASSFISISWPLATSDVLGTYRCDIIGFKKNLDVLVEKTPVLVVQKSGPTVQDAFDLWMKHRREIEQKIRLQKAYCDSLAVAIDFDINAAVAAMDESGLNATTVFQGAFLQEVDRLTKEVTRLKDTGVFQYWPEGSYALLTPDSGCPENVGALWATGYRKFHTESTDRNFDNISTPSHLQPPTTERVVTDNFIYQHFCVSSGRSPGPAWPRGSYCVNQVSNSCPVGFNSGYISWQDEVNNSKAAIAGAVPLGGYAANSTIIYYCCRNDGPPSNAIYLPMAKPFYLYRFNGACQEVAGMNTSPETVLFDTDNSNVDSYQNTFHPDGTINNVLIQLCYYSPQ